MPITTGSAPKSLWPGIHLFWGDKYEEHNMLYKDLFEIKTSYKAYEETPEIIGFGLAPEKIQGTSGKFDDGWRQSFVTRYTHKAYALGFIVTYEEMKDNQYPELMAQRVPLLAFSMRTTKEIVHANEYNRGFDSNFVGGDGKELLATDHPTDNGTQSNELAVAADLSETSLEDLAIQIANATNSRGLKVAFRPRRLIVSPSEMFNAERILGSVLQNDTANNAVNALKSMGAVSEGYISNPYLTDTDAWFLRTDAPNGMISFEREEVSFAEDNEFDTKNMKYLAYNRYEPGWSDFRGLYGSAGS